MQRLRPYLLLTRISLAPSAAMDAALGLAIGGLGVFPGWRVLLSACLASLCVFLGGMALNDWADREADSKTRPERPIPSGAISSQAALMTSIGLLALGVGLAFTLGVRPGICLLAVALLASTYDLVLRGPWSGPLALGLCRAGNVSFGILAGLSVSPELSFFLPAVGYGFYVWILSRLSPFEDGVREIRGAEPAKLLKLAAVTLALLPATAFALRPQPTGSGYLVAFGISFTAAFGLWQMATQTKAWSRGLVGKSMGMGLRRLMVATGLLACMVWHASPYPYAVTVAGFVGMRISHHLRLRFPPS